MQMMPLASKKPKKVGFNLVVTVDLRKEWEQIFEESWRVMKHLFYDPDMHGVDWEAARDAYKPLLAHVGTYEDAYDLANQMIGELNASHTGVSGPSGIDQPETYGTAELGFELVPRRDRYVVEHIYRDESRWPQMLDVLKEHYDYIVVDTASMLDELILSLIEKSEGGPIQIERADIVHPDGRRVTIIEDGEFRAVDINFDVVGHIDGVALDHVRLPARQDHV